MQLPQRSYSLASCYENALTIILRLSSLQAQTAGSSQDFRVSIRAALKAAMEQAKALGYSSEINQLAFFAAVAFLDESVLKMQNPAFADWAQRPLQEEMFQHNRAGEVFWDHLHTLLTRPDSPETADCLEVYCLCMLLGFKGKYALSASITPLSQTSTGGTWAAPQTSGEIHALIQRAREKIDRIRGAMSFMPDSAPAEVKRSAAVDRWSRGLGVAALVLAGVTVLAYGGFWLALSSGASGIR
jgi:type VI secretion system protein ImpK